MSLKQAQPAKPRRRRLPRGALATSLLIFVALGWTALWWFAAGESERTIDAWVIREKSFGRIWSCPERQIAGFPFAIEITCTKPRFDGIIFGQHFDGGLNGFDATAVVFHPRRVTARLAAPFAAQSDDRATDFTLAWSSLKIVLDGLPESTWHASIDADKLAWRGALQGVGPITGRAEKVSANAAEAANRTDQAYDFKVAITAATVPDLDHFLGASSPTNIDLQGTLTQASFDPALSVAQNMDRWRAAGGQIDIFNASLTHGQAAFAARGALSLDDSHRLDGKLDTESHGFAPVLVRLGVNPMLVGAGALLSTLFTGALPDRAASSPDTLNLTIGLNGGRISIGPAQTSLSLPPLY